MNDIINDNVPGPLTDICRIGVIKRSGNERTGFKKQLELSSLPDFAAVRFESQGVCGLFVNGNFVEASTGEYPGRIVYAEITSKLKTGSNEISLVTSVPDGSEIRITEY